MARQKWIQVGFWLLLCLWPFYILLSSLHYRLSPVSLEDDALLDDFIAHYPREKRDDMPMELSIDGMDERTFMLNTFVRDYPILRSKVETTLTEDVKKRLGGPIRSQEDHVQLLDLFKPLIACPSLTKAGNGTTGRWICGLETFLKGKDICHVYAFNWNVTDLSFELDVLDKTMCAVHVFDPFLSVEDQESVGRMHPRLLFHNQTLGSAHDRRYLFDELSEDLRSVEEMSLQQITAGLLHEWVDVIKLDYGGEEFSKAVEVIHQWKRAQRKRKRRKLFPAGQVLFQLGTGGDAKKIAQILIPLLNLGLSVFYMEPNLRTKYPWENVAFSFLNVAENRTFYDSVREQV